MSTTTFGMVGLGRMGANIVRRLARHNITSVVYDVSPDSVKALAAEGSIGAADLADLALQGHPVQRRDRQRCGDVQPERCLHQQERGHRQDGQRDRYQLGRYRCGQLQPAKHHGHGFRRHHGQGLDRQLQWQQQGV